MKSRYAAIQVFITMLSILLIAFGSLLIASYEQPKELKEIKGIVAEFYQHDEKWYEGFLGNSKGSYFSIEFADGLYFEATGIAYDHINSELFSSLTLGEEIQITFDYDNWKPRRIYSIQYRGNNYLPLDAVLADLQETAKIMHNIGISIIIASVIMGVSLSIVNYKRRKGN